MGGIIKMMSIGFNWKWTFIIFLVSVCFWIFYPSIQGAFTEEGQTTEQIPGLNIEYGKTSSEIEQEIFDLINSERARYADIGVELPILLWDKDLHNLAKTHSEFMTATGNFEHSKYSLNENIFWAEGYDSDRIGAICFEEWMLSPRHQANMLNKDIRLCGIAIVRNRAVWYVTFLAK